MKRSEIGLIKLLWEESDKESGLSTFISIVIGLLLVFSDNKISFDKNTIWYIIIYLIVGFLYSCVRVVGLSREEHIDAKQEGREVDQVTLNKVIKKKVFRWVFIWPINIVFWVLSDSMNKLFTLIWDSLFKFYKFLISLGHKIS